MRKNWSAVLVLGLFAGSAVAYADSAPFGVASAFNLVALTGNVGTQSDVGGRIAAAGNFTNATTIGSGLGADPYGSLADGYEMVTGKGVSTQNSINVDGGGNVYDPLNSHVYNWNEHPSGQVISNGASPINFTALDQAMIAETVELAKMAPTGTVGAPTPAGGNPSWLVLSGTNALVNVFNVTAAQFADGNHSLDIEVPPGSLVIINVSGTSVTLGTDIYYNGVQVNDSVASNLYFNFPDATAVDIDRQFDGAILAPYATLTGSSQMGGTFIAASIGSTGEVHYDAMNPLPPAPPVTPIPESSPLALVGLGTLSIAALAMFRIKRVA